MGELSWQRVASILFCLIGGGVLLYYAFRTALPILLPFLVGWGISLLIRPLAKRLSYRTKIPLKVSSVILLVLFVGGALSLILLATSRLLSELGHLLDRLLADGFDPGHVLDRAAAFLQGLGERFGLSDRFGDGATGEVMHARLSEWLTNQADRLLTSLASEIPRLIGALFAALPRLFLVTVVTAISGVYFCMDGERITAALAEHLPASIRRRLPAWRSATRRISWRYLRAYLLLTFLTFAELLIGFSILGIDYAFLLALLVAIVDLLPVLGVGTVLLPWALILLLQRHFYLGFGLLILYAACLLLRQILEPRLVGKSLGLHPLLTLLASYAGWCLLGIRGMILAPLLAVLCKSLLRSFNAPE